MTWPILVDARGDCVLTADCQLLIGALKHIVSLERHIRRIFGRGTRGMAQIG